MKIPEIKPPKKIDKIPLLVLYSKSFINFKANLISKIAPIKIGIPIKNIIVAIPIKIQNEAPIMLKIAPAVPNPFGFTLLVFGSSKLFSSSFSFKEIMSSVETLDCFLPFNRILKLLVFIK